MIDNKDNASFSSLTTELNRMVELFENTQINYQVLDNNFIIRYVNESWLNTLGYTREETLNKSFINFLTEDSKEIFEKTKKTILSGKFIGDFELSLKCRDSSEINVSYSCFLKHDKYGNLLGIYGVFQNITRLRKAEEALRISEDNYVRLFNSISDIYYQIDNNHIITRVSPSVKITAGYDPSELIGRPAKDFFAIDTERNKFTELLYEKGHVNDYDLKLFKKGNIVADASLSAQIILNDKNEMSGVEGLLRDISKRKEDEKKLRESEILYKTLAENSPEVIMRFDMSLRHLFVSSSVKNYVDIDPKDFIGKTHRELGFPAEKCDFWENALEKVFATGKKQYFDFNLSNKNKIFSFEWILVPEFGDNKKIETVLAISRDISERLKLQSALEEYNTRLTEITGSLPVFFFQLAQVRNKVSLLYVSPNVSGIFGIKNTNPLSFLGHILKIITPEDKNKIKEELLCAFKEKKDTSIEYKLSVSADIKRWFRFKVIPKIINKSETIWDGISWDVTEEVNMKEQLREQAERLKDLYEFTSVGIASMSKKGIITFVSPSIYDVTGYKEEELIGKHFREVQLFPKNNHRFNQKLFIDGLMNKLPEEKIIFEWIHKNGERRWGDAYLSAIRKDGKIKGFQGIFMDSTYRIHHEEFEKEKQENIKFLFNSAVKFLKVNSEAEFFSVLRDDLEKMLPDTIININSINDDLTQLRVESLTGLKGRIYKEILKLLDNIIIGRLVSINKDTFSFARYGKIIKVHENLYDMTFHTVPEIICRRIEKIIHLSEILEISIGLENRIMGSCVFFLKDGSKIDNPELIETYFKQATQTLVKIRTNERLIASEALYKSLSENTKNMILRVDTDLKFIYANKAFHDTFNLKPEFCQNNDFHNLGLPGKISDLIISTINRTIKSNQPQTCDTVINKNDSPCFNEWRLYPELDEKNTLQSILLVVRDISDRKNMEAKIQETIDVKNKMYSLIGHDLSSPFSGIIGMLDLLLTDKSLSESTRETYLKFAYESSLKINNLLYSLLEWSHEFENEGNIKPVFFDLAQLLDNTIGLFKLQILEKHLKVNNSIPSGIIINADYNMLAVSFRNFISNACKFSFKDGQIDISLKDNGNNVFVHIRDYGIGMTRDEINRLLDHELGFSKPGTLREQGNGLGFAFALEMIELNNGSVTIESAQKKGSLIKVKLKK